MNAKKRLLIAFAHPDDESFGLGGLIAKYVAEGVEVSYLCATNGDVGTVSEELLAGYNSIAELRIAELDCAAEKLGFKHVIKLGYKDSGMMHSETSQHPGSLWHTWGRRPDEVTRKVVETIRELKPHVVITFNRYGGYGHPDHIAIQQATTEAFTLAADPDYITGNLPAYTPQKLYYTSIPAYMVRMGIWRARLKGQDPRRMGRNNDIDMVRIIENVEPAHVKIDIKDYLDAWEEASACHVSQGGGSGGWLPKWLGRMLRAQQGLTRVSPVPGHTHIDEHDLFDGVTVERETTSQPA